MNLQDLTATYVAYKRALGMRFQTEDRVLKSFCRALGNIDAAEATPTAVLAYIAGTGPVTAHWKNKYTIIGGMYRFAASRGFCSRSPLPSRVPRLPEPLKPHIYTVPELRRLLAATDQLKTPKCPLLEVTFRMLLLLYGTGMRIGEAVSLRVQDVDLAERLITIRDTKFFKTRLVPTGPKLTAELQAYADQRYRLPLPEGAASAFFALGNGEQLRRRQAEDLFRQLRQLADVHRELDARYQPRLHDLRHTAAVHRVVAWYRAGADMQNMLPQLATYLGHVDLNGTQRYLAMTPELLGEASQLFERYAQPEVRHD